MKRATLFVLLLLLPRLAMAVCPTVPTDCVSTPIYKSIAIKDRKSVV